MSPTLSRRDFLKVSALGIAGLAFRPNFMNGEDWIEGDNLVRVARTSLSVHREPSDKSPILFQRLRDDLLNVYYEVEGIDGPKFNPLWYRVWGGYVHSGYTQQVKVRLNPVVSKLGEKMRLGQITVPYTRSYLHRTPETWTPNYRLYYESVHWITQVVEGPDGRPWYRIRDEMLYADNLDYYVPASHVYIFKPEELLPISPEIPAGQKWIEIDLDMQTVTAFEGDKVVLSTKVSTGVPYHPEGQVPWETPRGRFHIENKMPSKHMGEGILTTNMEEYVLPGVPWVSFFEPKNGVAFHGTYWHMNYGTPMSHGCINMRTDEAKWLYFWATPAPNNDELATIGYGTQVIIR